MNLPINRKISYQLPSQSLTGKTILAGLYIFFLLMLFQNLIKAYFRNQYLFVGYIMGIVLLVSALAYMFAKRAGIKIHDLDWLIIFYIFIQLLWTLPNLYQYPRATIMGLLYNIRNFLIPYAIIRFTITDLRGQKWLTKWMTFLIAVMASFGIYVFYYGFGIPGIFERAYYIGRRTPSFLFTTLDVAFCCMIFGLFMMAYLLEKNRVYSWVLKILYTGVFIFCLILTFTRSAYIGFIAGFLAILLIFLISKRINWKISVSIILVIAVVLAVMMFFLADNVLLEFPDLSSRIVITDDPNTMAHVENNLEALGIFIRHPFGIGLGRSGWTVTKWQLSQGIYFESSFLQAMVETGIAGALVLFMIWVKIILMCAGNYIRSKNPLFLGLFGATLAVFIASFFLPVYYYSTAMSFYWGLVAIAISFSDKDMAAGHVRVS
jgi:O-antigen ligase